MLLQSTVYLLVGRRQGVDQENRDCEFELAIRLSEVPLARVVLLVDDHPYRRPRGPAGFDLGPTAFRLAQSRLDPTHLAAFSCERQQQGAAALADVSIRVVGMNG